MIGVNLRGFLNVPKDGREWGRWIRESPSLDGTVDTSQITDLAVTGAKVADGTLGTTKLGVDITTAGKALLDDADAVAQRATLGLGTAAVKNTGTSGNTVPLLDGANTYSAKQTFSLPPKMPSYTVATVPSAATYEGCWIYVTDETGGKTMAMSDGTNWRRMQDRNIVS